MIYRSFVAGMLAMALSSTAEAAAKGKPGPVPIATRALRDITMDPAAVQFRDIITKGTLVCGKYNAKNSYGAYIGFKSFFFDTGMGQGFVSDGLVRFNSNGIIESGDSITNEVKKPNANAKEILDRLDKLGADASAMAKRCDA